MALKFFDFYKANYIQRRCRIEYVPNLSYIEDIVIGPDENNSEKSTYFLKIILNGRHGKMGYYREDGSTKESLEARAKWILSNRTSPPPRAVPPPKRAKAKKEQYDISMVDMISQRDNRKLKESIEQGKPLSPNTPRIPRPVRTNLSRKEKAMLRFKERERTKEILKDMSFADFHKSQHEINGNHRLSEGPPKPRSISSFKKLPPRSERPPRPKAVAEGVLNLLSPEDELYRPLLPMPRPSDAGYENLPPPESEQSVDEHGNYVNNPDALTMFEQESLDSFLEEEAQESQLSEEEKPDKKPAQQPPNNVPNPRK